MNDADEAVVTSVVEKTQLRRVQDCTMGMQSNNEINFHHSHSRHCHCFLDDNISLVTHGDGILCETNIIDRAILFTQITEIDVWSYD